jgi:hypothetical protein
MSEVTITFLFECSLACAIVYTLSRIVKDMDVMSSRLAVMVGSLFAPAIALFTISRELGVFLSVLCLDLTSMVVVSSSLLTTSIS